MQRLYTEKEPELLRQLQQGNENALALLMRHYYNDLYHYGISLTCDNDLVKDVIQEVFISLWQKRHNAGAILSPRFYLLRAVRNLCLKALQQQRRYKPLQAEPTGDFSIEFSVEQKIIEHQLAEERDRKLQAAIAGLSARQKEVIYLKFYQRLDAARVAELMGISVQSVYNLLHEAITRLRGQWPSAFMLRAV
jgi:RNA polymerase sigma factor (sigma-70 family)